MKHFMDIRPVKRTRRPRPFKPLPYGITQSHAYIIWCEYKDICAQYVADRLSDDGSKKDPIISDRA